MEVWHTLLYETVQRLGHLARDFVAYAPSVTPNDRLHLGSLGRTHADRKVAVSTPSTICHGLATILGNTSSTCGSQETIEILLVSDAVQRLRQPKDRGRFPRLSHFEKLDLGGFASRTAGAL